MPSALWRVTVAGGAREGMQPRPWTRLGVLGMAGHLVYELLAGVAVANGLFLSAVISHYTSWPRTRRGGLPSLVECEGLDGWLMGPYNLLLQGSAVAAIGGLIENRRAWPAPFTTVCVAVPVLRSMTPREYERLLAQAAVSPRWWNRRLAARMPGSHRPRWPVPVL